MLFALDLATYWWVVYGLVFGSVATMYVSLNHLASCNAPTFRLPWDVAVPVPSDALSGWRIVNGRWTNGVIATKATEDGTVLTLHGDLLNGATFLFFERLLSPTPHPRLATWALILLPLPPVQMSTSKKNEPTALMG